MIEDVSVKHEVNGQIWERKGKMPIMNYLKELNELTHKAVVFVY